MSLELLDLRAKITAEAHCALTAYARAHEVEMSEVVRDVLHAWATRQIREASMLTTCLRAKGLSGADAGAKPADSALLWSLEDRVP